MADVTMADTERTPLFMYEPGARRLEFLVRIPYWVAIGVLAWVYGVLAMVCLIAQWFWILVLGKRSERQSDFAGGYLEYLVHRMPYVYLMTDKRPAVMPDKVKIYEEIIKEKER